MDFGIWKSATLSINRGLRVESSGIDLPLGETIKSLEEDCAYKYLGVLEADNIKQKEIKKKIIREYIACCHQILRSLLYACNKIGTINMYAVAVIRYSAGIVNWTKEDLDNLDRRTWKLMTITALCPPPKGLC